MSGPLMTSAIAMFGEASSFAFLNTSTNTTASFALTQACQHNLIPFSAFDVKSHTEACEAAGSDDFRLSLVTKKFLDKTFFDTEDTPKPTTSSSTPHSKKPTPTLPDPSTHLPPPLPPLTKPRLSLASLIVISLLILIQALGLAYLAYYIYQVPTWTDMLDAMAVARIANSLDKADIPALGLVDRRDLEGLRGISALVGVGRGARKGSRSARWIIVVSVVDARGC
ncbi:hypothetical protein L13192_00627 [Pyrenophora tritici-repentis]|nr:hypothetical protein L13192_00627 [Pyrenophora tritici-repentis]KAI1689031.1 hypothetical protein KJE20_02209 [Pyrenophora tritici-repentis]